jgi:hypothetical protein
MFNRPFDEQEHIRIRLETEAKLAIQKLNQKVFKCLANISAMLKPKDLSPSFNVNPSTIQNGGKTWMKIYL